MSNVNWMSNNEIQRLETLSLRLKLAANDGVKAANDLICTIDKSNGQLKRALCKSKKEKVH